MINFLETHFYELMSILLLILGFGLLIYWTIEKERKILFIFRLHPINNNTSRRIVIIISFMLIVYSLFLLIYLITNSKHTSNDIASIIFGGIGLVGVVITGIQLRKIEKTNLALDKGIIRLEDATRRNLSGFPEIYARAIWLLDQAVGNVYICNFLLSFGEPHKCNVNLKDEYETQAKSLNLNTVKEDGVGDASKFDDAVNVFQIKMLEKIRKTFNSITIIRPDIDYIRQHFIPQLKKMDGYSNLDSDAIISNENALFEKLKNARKDRESFSLQKDDVKFVETNNLPLQLIIAQIYSKYRTAAKWGCLVFLVGSENVGKGKPRGYYSELDHIVFLHKDLFESLLYEKPQISLD